MVDQHSPRHARTRDDPGSVVTRPGIWRFGRSEVDERLALLTVDGHPAPLDRSSYDVLLTLLRHAGEVVGKDELLDAGWPGRVVSENSLAKAVGRLRQALGEDAHSLKVVHGYGYRLVARVRYEAVPASHVQTHPHQAERLRAGDALPHRPGWTLVRRLGEGSAGVTYLAHSALGEERAIKLATGEPGLRSLRREIALERYMQALHAEPPGLARLSGWNLSHPPFFLEMPYFAHGHLRDWAEARGGLATLPLEARLGLCADLCDTLAGLHAIGIIHKDLKPENLYPVPVAQAQETLGASSPDPPPWAEWRLLLSDLGAGQAAITPRLAELDMGLSLIDPVPGVASGPAGTLLYMAPEVIAGDIPTQRSDVFALGVLLYQLVVGDLRRTLAPGWEHDVADPLLRDDIAAAAAADPQRRLLDPAELAERLRRLPARREAEQERARREEAARRQSAQLQQLQQRRRRWSAGSAVLAAFLAVSLWQQRATERERAHAVHARAVAQTQVARTEAVVEFLTQGVLRQADPYANADKPVSLREAIDRAAGNIDTRFAGDPQIAASLHGTLAAAYQGMNAFDEASKHFTLQVSHLRDATPRDAEGLARAQAALCIARHWQGGLPRAQAACEQARRDYVAAGLEPDLPEVFLALGDNRRDRSQAVLRRIGPRLARIRATGDVETLGYALSFHGIAQSRLGDLVGAERTFAELVELRRRQHGERSMQLAWALADHGRTQLQLGLLDAGERSLAQSQRMFDEVAGNDHPQSRIPAIHLAAHALTVGDWQQARAIAQPQYAFLRRETGWQHWTIYAALPAMVAAARLGDAADARQLMAALEGMAREDDLERGFPYLREPYWSHMLEAHLALGEPASARAYLAKLHGLTADGTVGRLLPARLQCYEGAIAQAEGQTTQAREALRDCRRRLLSLVPAASPLLMLPQRLVATARAATAAGSSR